MGYRNSTALGLVLVAAACGAKTDPNLFNEGERLYLDQRYDEAVKLFKRYLIEKPNDAGAHFYLGTCYLYSTKNAWLGIAQGELQTALALFERQGKVSPVPRFDDAVYFELICHINLAKIYLRSIYDIAAVPQRQLRTDRTALVRMLATKVLDQYEAARAIAPDHADVRWLADQMSGIRQLLSSPRNGFQSRATASNDRNQAA